MSSINSTLRILKGLGITPRMKYVKYDEVQKIVYYRNLYFSKFKLESDVEEFQEVKRIIHDYELKKIFQKQFNLTIDFIKSIVRHLKKHSNAIFMTYGLPNSGKSEVNQSIAINFIRRFALKLNMNTNVYVIFETSELSKIAPKLKHGDCVILDEMPDLQGAGSINFKKDMNNITKIVRQYQIFFFFTSPELIRLKVVNYYIETYGKNYKDKTSRCKLHDKKGDLVGLIYVKLHDDTKFREEYLARKTANIKKLLKNGGKVVGTIDRIKLKEDIDKLYNIAIECGAEKKDELKFLLLVKDHDIVGDGNYIDGVISGTMFKLKHGNIELDELKLGDDFTYTDLTQNEEKVNVITNSELPSIVNNDNSLEIEDDFPEFVYNEEKKKGVSETIAKCRSLLTKGYTYEKIKESLNIRSDDWIFNTIDKWKNPSAGDKCDAWKLLEKWISLKVGANIDNTGGNVKGKVDVMVNNLIISVKWRYENSNRMTFYQTGDNTNSTYPEYKKAKELGINYYLLIYNPQWKENRLNLILIDPDSDDKIVIDKNKGRIIK
jgi:hypothetical protein